MAEFIKSWDQIIGHDNIVRYLRKQVEQDSIQDVMIFHGNSGLGKSAIAKLLAVDITTRGDFTLRQEYIESVIERNQSTDAIKLFSMSNVADKEEEILRAKTELTTAFTKNKRKVLIFDEAQGMSEKAQDSILIELEHLPKGVYVIFCTTAVGKLQDALQSRCKTPIHLKDLSDAEIRKLIKRNIENRGLRFDMKLETVIAVIATWANNQPRKALNLLENFESGSIVTARDIEVFIDTNSGAAMVELLKYLYGSLTLGMDYLESLKYDSMLPLSIAELCKVALGHTSQIFSAKDITYIKEFMRGKDARHIIQFTAEVAGLPTITKRRVLSAFMRAHVAFQQVPPTKFNTVESKAEDLRTIEQNIQTTNVLAPPSKQVRVETLENLLAMAELVEEE